MKPANISLDSLNWSHFDEDRWIVASIITVIVCIGMYYGLQFIGIPEMPEKVIIEDDYERVITFKNQKPDITVRDKSETNTVAGFGAFIKELKNNTIKLPGTEKMLTNNPYKNINADNPTRENVTTKVVFNHGYNYDNSKDNRNAVIQGRPTETKNVFIYSKSINDDLLSRGGIRSDGGLADNSSPTQADAISGDYVGFQGEVAWEDWIDPLLEWIRNNQSPIYDVAKDKMNVLAGDHTARKEIIVTGVNYELLLASKPGKRQLTFLLINKRTGDYVMLIDQGIKKSSNYYNYGRVDFYQNDIEFTGTAKRASDQQAKVFTKIFWSWANTVIEK